MNDLCSFDRDLARYQASIDLADFEDSAIDSVMTALAKERPNLTDKELYEMAKEYLEEARRAASEHGYYYDW